MEAKFTKGDWVVWGDWAIKSSINGELIASFECYGGRSQESFANANLIASAPDMYSKLKEIADNNFFTVEIEEILSKARGE